MPISDLCCGSNERFGGSLCPGRHLSASSLLTERITLLISISITGIVSGRAMSTRHRTVEERLLGALVVDPRLEMRYGCRHPSFHDSLAKSH
ncbi:hypothetical protein CEXT_370101 [Caerostris extrusa]|uniref:Uncharacterized protein n=1 Tax=Caerostris extrusa TaxID=172846 RepID=A0AAV4NEN4_CAEEX|nr:hypothetical protein CEXT_370101 [Caerostris extrusa]